MASSNRIICSSLTDDILIEIFTYLPLNSIYKFQCLSKVWLSNLSNPNFIIKWFKTNSKSLPWVLYHTIRDKGDDENPFKFRMAYDHDLGSEFMSRNQHLFSLKFHKPSEDEEEDAKLFLLGSSNGLILCSLHGSSDNQFRFHVCNPLTRKWVSLPPPPSRLDMEGWSIKGISCEHSSSSSFASCYKVVRIHNFEKKSLKKFGVDVFSSDLGVWQIVQVYCDENVLWGNFDKIVVLNGVFFWIEGGHRLLVYNLNQKNQSDGHRCSLIKLPDSEFGDMASNNYHGRIAESQGCVCYAKTKWKGREMTLSVWVLNEVNWKILHKDISLGSIMAELRSRVGEEPIGFKVLGFSPVDGNVVLLGEKQWVWRFNMHTRSFEELCLDNSYEHDLGVFLLPFVFKPMPTVLPPPSWIDN